MEKEQLLEILKELSIPVVDGKVHRKNVFSALQKAEKPLKCDMKADCKEPVSYIDERGWVYCKKHGLDRKYSMRCRQLRPDEIKQLESGQPLEHF